MVFTGKPSTGCQMCRTRRIKCDEASPACNQCTRTGRTCPGYQSRIDLLFRNETGATATEKRARTTARKKAAAALRGRQTRQAGRDTPEVRSGGGQDAQDAAVALPDKTADWRSGSSDIDSLEESIAKASIRYLNSRSQKGVESDSVYDFAVGDTNRESSSRTLVRSSYSSRGKHYYQRTIKPALSTPPDELAVCYFFSNFVLVPLQGSGRGYMDFLVPLMKASENPTSLYASISSKEAAALRATRENTPRSPDIQAPVSALTKPTDDEARSALTLAFRACALASMGTRISSDGYAFADKSLSAYTRALAATNLALRDAVLSKSDSTLGAVLLLSLFESITAKHMGLFAWGSHIDGAVELVKGRSQEQRKTRTGLSLFITVRTQMIIQCFASGRAPDLGTDWWMKDAVSDSFAAASQKLALRTATLRAHAAECMASTSERSPENVARIMDLAQQASAIDHDCAAWEAGVPAEWRFQTVAWYDKIPEGNDYGRSPVFPGKVDAYRDVYIVSVWNFVRIIRLCLASISVRCAAWACAPADYRTTSQYAAAARTCSGIIADVIASVPYFLGAQSNNGHPLGQTFASSNFGSTSPRFALTTSGSSSAGTTTFEHEPTPGLGFVCGDEKGLKGLAGYLMAWPLSNINCQDFTTDNQRAWVLGRLKYISNELGVRYAGFLAELKLRVPSMMIRRDRLMAQKNHLESLHMMQTMLSTSSAIGGSATGSSATEGSGVSMNTPVSLASPEPDAGSASGAHAKPTTIPTGNPPPLNPLQQ